MAGGMEVHKNAYVEAWGYQMENLEKTFRFTRRNIAICLIFGVAVPLITYKGITGEMVSGQDGDSECGCKSWSQLGIDIDIGIGVDGFRVWSLGCLLFGAILV